MGRKREPRRKAKPEPLSRYEVDSICRDLLEDLPDDQRQSEHMQVCELLMWAFKTLGDQNSNQYVIDGLAMCVYGGTSLWKHLGDLLSREDSEELSAPSEVADEQAGMRLLFVRSRKLLASLKRAEAGREQGKLEASRKDFAAACETYRAARGQEALQAEHPNDLERNWAPHRRSLFDVLLVNETICLYKMGDLGQALKLIKESRAGPFNMFSHNFKAQFWHAKVLAGLGNRGEALSIAKRLREPREYCKWENADFDAGKNLYIEIKSLPTGRGAMPFKGSRRVANLVLSIDTVDMDCFSDDEDDDAGKYYFARNLERAKVVQPQEDATDIDGRSVLKLTLDSGDSSIYAFGGVHEHFPNVEGFTYKCNDCLRVVYDFRDLAHWVALQTLHLQLSGQAQIAEGDHGLEVLAPLVNLKSFHVQFVRHGSAKDIRVVEQFAKLIDFAYWGNEIDAGEVLDLSRLACLSSVLIRGLSFCSAAQRRLKRSGTMALRCGAQSTIVAIECTLTNKLRSEITSVASLHEFTASRGKVAEKAASPCTHDPCAYGAPSSFVPDAQELVLRTAIEMAVVQCKALEESRRRRDEGVASEEREQRKMEARCVAAGIRRPEWVPEVGSLAYVADDEFDRGLRFYHARVTKLPEEEDIDDSDDSEHVVWNIYKFFSVVPIQPPCLDPNGSSSNAMTVCVRAYQLFPDLPPGLVRTTEALNGIRTEVWRPVSGGKREHQSRTGRPRVKGKGGKGKTPC